MITLRSGTRSPGDYEAFCQVAMAAGLDFPVDGQQMRERDEACLKQGAAIDYWFAVDDADPVTALGAATAFTLIQYAAPGRRFLMLGVRPEAEGRGIGAQLCARALSDLRTAGVTELIGCICDHRPRGLRFAQDRGFERVVGEVECELRLDLAGRDLSALDPLLDRVHDAGIRITTLPVLQAECAAWFERLYALWIVCNAQIPTTLTHTTPSPDAFRATHLDWPGAMPEAYFLALDGDEWVGLSELRERRGAEWPIFPGLTGVLPSHRGRGIATALKVMGLHWAQDAGHTKLSTHNAQGNIAMLTANERVGFQRWASWHTVRMHL